MQETRRPGKVHRRGGSRRGNDLPRKSQMEPPDTRKKVSMPAGAGCSMGGLKHRVQLLEGVTAVTHCSD